MTGSVSFFPLIHFSWALSVVNSAPDNSVGGDDNVYTWNAEGVCYRYSCLDNKVGVLRPTCVS